MKLVLDNKNMNRMLYFIISSLLVVEFLINNLHVPSIIMYIYDGFILLSLIYCAKNITYRVQAAGVGIVAFIFLLILFCASFNLFLNRYSIIYFINGLRTNLRFGFIFLICACIATPRTAISVYKLLNRAFWINVVFCSIQYFIFGIKGDYCNGIFGTEKVNSWLNVLLCIVLAYNVALYLNKVIKPKYVICYCFACIYVAVLAELKFFFFEMIIIIVAIILLNKPSLRTVFICVSGGMILTIMINAFNSAWGVSGTSTFSIEGIQDYFTEKSYGYAFVGDWGRIGGIGKAIAKFFSSGINILGMGLGYCGYGTPFYNRYNALHYIWFGYITVFMEQGWVGLILYYLFYAGIIVCSKKQKNYLSNPIEKSMHDVTESMAIIAMFLTFYNSTIINYPAVLLFAVMALSFKVNNSFKVSSCGGRLR